MSQCGCIRVDDGGLVPLEDLMRFVSAAIPAVPYEVGLDYLRQAYIDFSRKSRLLASHQIIETQRGVNEYLLKAPEGYQVFGLLQNSGRHGYHYIPTPHRWFLYTGHRVKLLGNSILFLEQTPSTDGHKIKIALHLIPTDCVGDIPEEISTPYGRGIAKGAIAELLQLPGKAWSNLPAGAKYERDFHITCQAGLNLHLTNRGAHSVMMDPVRVL